MSGIGPVFDSGFIALFSEGFFYGTYSAIFVVYLQYQISKKCADTKRITLLSYSLCTLYFLSAAVFVTDVARVLIQLTIPEDFEFLYYTTSMISTIISGYCDFVAQSVLIYRCWIVWNRDIYVIIIPSGLAFIYLVSWLVGIGASSFDQTAPNFSGHGLGWGVTVTGASIAASLAVNTLVMGLIVFKIFKVYWEVKPLYGQTFASTGGNKLRSLIFILIESGTALFSIQLAWLVLYTIPATPAAKIAIQPINYIYHMLIGITPTMIQMRVAMGLSFHDEQSMVEITSGLRFGPVNDDSNSILEMGDGMINIDQQETRG